MRKIKVIVKRPEEKYGHVCHISDSLENLQKTVGGHIETLTSTDFVIILNEEGKIEKLPFNMPYHGDFLVGTIIVAGIEGDELCDIKMTFEQWKRVVDSQ